MKFGIAFDPLEMNQRLWRRPTPQEFFALALALCAAGLFAWMQPNLPFAGVDLKIYLEASRGTFQYQGLYYYYGYWILPIFAVLSKFPFFLAYFLWSSINIIGIFFAERVFGGKALVAVASYQLFYNLIYGNISGLIVGGLALCWYGLVNKKWALAGLGIALASAKYQIGLTGSLLLILTAPILWKDRLRVFIIPAVIWILSLFVYPGWPLEVFHTIQNHPPDALGSISLWRWLGPWSLLFFFPPLLLNRESPQRFIAFVAAIGLGLPYFQQVDLLFLLVMPIGWIGLLGNLGYLMGFYRWTALQFLFLLPLAVYIWALISSLVKRPRPSQPLQGNP